MTEARSRREERITQARRDLQEIADQLADGELTESQAEDLRARYEQEIADVTQSSDPGISGPSLARVLVGTALMTVAIIGVVFLVANAVEDREPGDFVTGNIEDRDLSDVTTEEMEQVVADFPNVVGMRLSLARRYFDAGDFSSALPHYLTILEQDARNPEANANLGWMTFLSDQSQATTAAAFLERALDAVADYPQASYYLANVRLYGLDDAAGAAVLLRPLSERSDLPDDIAASVSTMLAEAGSGS